MSVENEIWVRADSGECGRMKYEVSRCGKVRSIVPLASGLLKYKTLNLYTKRSGYLQVQFIGNGSRKWKMVHRLIAIAFIPNPLGKRCVNHKNGIKTDNRIENLEWCTHKENTLHAIETGLIVFKNHDCKGFRVKPSFMDSLLDMRKNGATLKAIAKTFGISKGSAWNYAHRANTDFYSKSSARAGVQIGK